MLHFFSSLVLHCSFPIDEAAGPIDGAKRANATHGDTGLLFCGFRFHGSF
jgi:hypothetical protein